MAATSKGDIDKSNKYDRQIRLWGDHGQTALEGAHVCLINASATGTEILKNLILPGIGSFTIVDGHKVLGEDVGNSFFLTKESIGQSRAKVATELLGELNEDVNGDFVEEFAENLLVSNPEFFTSFSIVIATNICKRQTLLKLASLLWDANIPLLVCRTYGFIGYMRLVIKEHVVVESHPDNAFEDLRLDHPFSGLVEFCNSLNMSTMNKKDHSHTPWLVVLYKYLQEWKMAHNGEGPKNYREKNGLKEMIKNGVLRNKEGVPEEEENFDEAMKSVNTALVPTKVSSEILNLFSDPACTNLHTESRPFWILVRALKEFVINEGGGLLPLRGTIPDMTSDSVRYVQLQQVYRQQAAEHVAIVTQKVQDLLQTIGKASSISEQEIKTFCRNAAFLRVIRCRSLTEEFDPQTAKVAEIGSQLEDENNGEIVFYVLLRAVDMFYEEYNRFPGWYNDQVESDVPKLRFCLNSLLHEWGLSTTLKDDYLHEICRYGASELHTVASFIGGAAAQEAIKVITHQFVPITNAYIYNAMKQTSVTIEV